MCELSDKLFTRNFKLYLFENERKTCLKFVVYCSPESREELLLFLCSDRQEIFLLNKFSGSCSFSGRCFCFLRHYHALVGLLYHHSPVIQFIISISKCSEGFYFMESFVSYLKIHLW